MRNIEALLRQRPGVGVKGAAADRAQGDWLAKERAAPTVTGTSGGHATPMERLGQPSSPHLLGSAPQSVGASLNKPSNSARRREARPLMLSKYRLRHKSRVYRPIPAGNGMGVTEHLLSILPATRQSAHLYIPTCFLRIGESLMAGFVGASSAAFLNDAVASSCFPILSSVRAKL
jgi:hypothetical protein